MSHQLLGRQQRHRKERAKSKHEAAEKRQASGAIYQHQLEQHAVATQQALAAGLTAPPAPEAPKSKRRAHHTKDGSIRNHRGAKRPARGGRGGGRPADGTAERKKGDEGEEEEESDEADGGTARARDDRKEDDSSDYTSNTSSEDEAPPEAAVYSFVPPRASHSTASAAPATKPAPGTNKPVLPPSLREQSLLVAKQQSTQQRDELDELLHMDEGKGAAAGGAAAGRTATVSDSREQKVKSEDTRHLEDELDDLLNL